MFKIIKAFCFFSAIKLFGSFSQVNSVDIDDCTTITNHLYNKKYMFCDDKEKWSDAQQFCNNYNGELLTIQNSNENNWIYSERQKHDTSSDIWVGLKTSNYNDWTWVNNQENGYINWKPGTPDGNRKVNCARILPYSKRLNDMRCDRSYDFICQIIIPSTTTPTSTLTTTPTTTLTSTPTTTLTSTPTTTPTSTLTTTPTTTLTSTLTTTLTITPTTTPTSTLTTTPTTTLTSTPTTTLTSTQTTTLTSTQTTTLTSIKGVVLFSTISTSNISKTNLIILVIIVFFTSLLMGMYIGKKCKSKMLIYDKAPIIPMMENPLFTNSKENNIHSNNCDKYATKNIIENTNYDTLIPNHQIYQESQYVPQYEIPVSCNAYYNESSNTNASIYSIVDNNMYSCVTINNDKYGFEL